MFFNKNRFQIYDENTHKLNPSSLSHSALFLIFFTFAAVLSRSLIAEEVHMKDGKVISGRVTGQNTSNIEIKTATGSLWLAKAKIKKIIYQPTTEEEKKAKRDAQLKRLMAQKAARLKIEKEIQEKEEKDRLLKELEEKTKQEALEIAQEKARRAEALRELVQNQTMEKPVDEPISYWDFAWRSIVLPGWGHFYLERPTVGAIYSGGSAFLVFNVYRSYREAQVAKKMNHDEVMNNFILTGIPQLAPQAIRAAYSLEANRRAATDYKNKVKVYNYSLFLLGAFYGTQIVHIIYNGIAWENGLPVVDKTDKKGKLKFSAIVFPEIDSWNNRKGIMGQTALTLQF